MNPYQPTHPPSPAPQEPKEDIRVQVTKTIWGCTTGMLGISIPIIGILDHSYVAPAIPIIIMGCAAASTAAVWMFGGKKSQQNASQTAEVLAMQEKMRELEERLANVEVISTFERGLAERTVGTTTNSASIAPTPQVAPVPLASPMSANEDTLAPSPDFSTYKKQGAKEYRDRGKNQPLAS